MQNDFTHLSLKQINKVYESNQYISRFEDGKSGEVYFHENIEEQVPKEDKEEFEYDYNNHNLNWVQIEAKW